MHREHRPENGVDVLELLAYEAQRQVIKAVTAVPLRKAHAREAYRRELGEDLRIVVTGAVIGADRRRKLARAKVPDGRHQLLLVGGEGQVEHG